MKKFLFIAAAIITGFTAMAQQSASALIKPDVTKYDFGKLKQGVPAVIYFTVTNKSDKPVVIESATASCGCTTPTWPQAPVAKGKTDKLKAGFNAAAPGAFTKQITVKVAGATQPMVLTIKGEVLNADAYAQFQKSKSK